MASESSSAVLDLNDGDVTEDTEAPSVMEDANEEVPLIMEHGCDIAVKVDAPIKQLSTLETYVAYRVRCVCARWPTPPRVRRRYNHFRVLHKRLAAAHPLIAVPPLPPHHSAREQLDRYSPSFVAVRTLALNAFLTRVARHPILTHSEHLRAFVTTPDEELATVFKGEGGALSLWGLSARAHDKPTNGARVKDPEFSSAADYLGSLQMKLSALCALTVKLHKGSVSLGNELMGMKRACDAWATQAGGLVSRYTGAVGAGAGAAAAARAASMKRACDAWATQAGGLVSRYTGAVGAGAGAAAAARAARPAPLTARATLPLLAAYSQAHLEKIRQRDAIHAAYVAGNSTGDLHNRLEQASEALRSELSDWIPQTRSEVKALLLELAERQVTTHAQTLLGWETALQVRTEANVDELFKTVSKTAVQNLSPAKYAATPTETERDFEDIESTSSDLSKVDADSDISKDKQTDSPRRAEPSDPLTDFADVDLSS